MNLFGFEVEVLFLVKDGKALAYAWHYSKEKARKHMHRICEYHNLKGSISESKELENWLSEKLRSVVIRGEKFTLPEFEYRNRRVYERITEIPKGKVATYSDIAKMSGVKYVEMLVALMRNPFQILIPCHRLVTKKGTLMGFYPLGKEVKEALLKIEGESKKPDHN